MRSIDDPTPVCASCWVPSTDLNGEGYCPECQEAPRGFYQLRTQAQQGPETPGQANPSPMQTEKPASQRKSKQYAKAWIMLYIAWVVIATGTLVLGIARKEWLLAGEGAAVLMLAAISNFAVTRKLTEMRAKEDAATIPAAIEDGEGVKTAWSP